MKFIVQKVVRGVLAAGWLLALGWPAVQAQPVVVGTAFVQAAPQRGVQVWDVRDARDYAKAHLPGALTIGDAAKELRNPNSEDFIATERIAKLLGAAGIDPARETIVYGARGTWNPYFGRYALRHFGARQAYVYHDGIEEWQAVQQPVESGAAKPTPVTLQLQPAPDVSIDTAGLRSRLGQPDAQILDVRTPREFAGDDIRALRGGHIPGAVNIPYEQNWLDPETVQKRARKEVPDTRGMALRPAAELKALYAGLDPDKETIVYCQSGARASEAAGVLEQLGFSKVRIYDSSWLGWANTLDAPAANQQFVNIGALNSRLSALQTRVDTLEKELAAARKGGTQ